MSTRRDQDIERWKTWKRTRAPSDLGALLKGFEGLLAKEVGRWSGVLAKEVLWTEAERLAKESFESYDPKMGAALSTHLTNHLQKLSRTVYQHQNVGRIPEYQTLKINSFQRAHAELESSLGRPPSTAELSTHMAWSTGAVEKMRKELRREAIESNDLNGTPTHERSEQDAMLDLVYHDLNPLQKAIFEHRTGYGGAPVLDGKELTSKLKISQGQLSYELGKVVNKIKRVMPT